MSILFLNRLPQKRALRSGTAERQHRLVTSLAHADAPRGLYLYRDLGKVILDLIIVLLVAPFAIPLVAFAVVLLMFDGGKPFFWQARVGQKGRTFWMLKLRTMVPDAEEKLEAYLAESPDARLEWEQKQKLESDPRITRIGHFLRKSSLDELPQLWNVLCGDMSIVGPRPMMVTQKSLYPGTEYYALRPGITGNWQVSDRHRSNFADRAHFDGEYHRTLSLWTDLRIIVRTVAVVLRATGC